MQDTAVISPVSREHESYMSAIKALPEVRSDTVEKSREMLNTTVNYPPLQVIKSISALMGQIG